MQKETKQFMGIIVFFTFAFVMLGVLFFTTQKANQLFDFLINQAENMDKNDQLVPKKYHGHHLEMTAFSLSDNNLFISATLMDVSPLLCSQILNRQRPFMIDVFLNDKPVFFGSDWRCFKKLNHKMTFQFETYNYSTAFHMHEPTPCLDLFDCDVENDEICHQGYCLKSIVKE